MDISFIRDKIRRKEYVIDPEHVLILRKRGVNVRDIEYAILTGEIIETYPGDLILGFVENDVPRRTVSHVRAANLELVYA